MLVWFAGERWPSREDCILETKCDGTEHLWLPECWRLWCMHSSLSVSRSAEIHSLPLQTAQWCISLCCGLALPIASESARGKPGQAERSCPQTGLKERIILCFLSISLIKFEAFPVNRITWLIWWTNDQFWLQIQMKNPNDLLVWSGKLHLSRIKYYYSGVYARWDVRVVLIFPEVWIVVRA